MSTTTTQDEQAPSTLQLCMGIVQDYKQGEVSKIVAVRSILTIFAKMTMNEDSNDHQLEAVITTYFTMIDQLDNTRSLTASQEQNLQDNRAQR